MYIDNKNPASVVDNLVGFALPVLRLYPDCTTINPFISEPLPLIKQQNEKLRKLLQVLVHVNTLLNRIYRIKDKNGRYMSQKEDYINSLNLMKELLEYYNLKAGRYEYELIEKISIRFPPGTPFSRSDMEEITGYSGRHTNRILQLLKGRDKVKIIGGSRYRGYKYTLSEKQEPEDY